MTTLLLPGGWQLRVQNGQCLLDDLDLWSFTQTSWWKQYWRKLQQHVTDAAGQPDHEKIVLSRAGLDPSLLRHHIVLVFRTCARNLLQACMTVGELVVSLLLDGDTSCHACSLMLIRQCAQHFTASFYVYAAPRASAYEKLGGTTLPASIKEAAVNKVVSGEKATLEDAVEGMGYTRKCAATIFLDSWTDLLASSRSLASSRCYIVLCYATGPRQRTHVPQPAWSSAATTTCRHVGCILTLT